MKKKKKKLVKYQGKNSIVNTVRDAATTILSSIPKPKIQGITKTTNIDFPTPKADTSSTSKSKKAKYPKELRGPDYNPNLSKGGSVTTKWTRNTSSGSRRCK